MSAHVTRQAILLVTVFSLSLGYAAPSLAQEADRLGSIEKQIRALQAELSHMKSDMAERKRDVRAAQDAAARAQAAATRNEITNPTVPAGYALVAAGPGAAPGSMVLAKIDETPRKKLPKGSFEVGGVNVQLGGFFEAAGFYRSRNEATDLASSFTSGIPERNSPLYHEPESGFSARQSRITAAMTAEPDSVTKLTGYLAVDFLGAAPTANYNESNSWTPRLREAWIDYARSDWGLYVLGGQSWSLATMNTLGVDPTAINAPLQIDPQYVPGFNWARQAQFRIAKNLGSNQYWVALSVENPSTIVSGTVPTIEGYTINQANPGIGVDATGNSITNNLAPDVIVKGTADYPFAHFEAYGLGRVFNNRVSTLGSGQNNVVYGGGFGGGAIVHLIPKILDFQVSGLFGDGVGRYGTSQLADATYNYKGDPVALPGYSGLAGLVAHPDKANDIYAYFGVEHVDSRFDLGEVKGKLATLAGYGSSLINNTSCETEDATEPAECSPATSGDAQITVGNWYKFIQGPYGKMQVGAQYSYTRRYVFQGIGPTPKTDENMVFVSFRWYPFT
jgi:outer membrane murein-binding lipoprotein Lpp